MSVRNWSSSAFVWVSTTRLSPGNHITTYQLVHTLQPGLTIKSSHSSEASHDDVTLVGDDKLWAVCWWVAVDISFVFFFFFVKLDLYLHFHDVPAHSSQILVQQRNKLKTVWQQGLLAEIERLLMLQMLIPRTNAATCTESPTAASDVSITAAAAWSSLCGGIIHDLNLI